MQQGDGVTDVPGHEVQQRFLSERVRIPQHVVFRTFVNETVVLNLETGLYHGLNPTAGRMLELLAENGEVAATARRLSEESGVPEERVTADLEAFCANLVDRGLITLDGDG